MGGGKKPLWRAASTGVVCMEIHTPASSSCSMRRARRGITESSWSALAELSWTSLKLFNYRQIEVWDDCRIRSSPNQSRLFFLIIPFGSRERCEWKRAMNGPVNCCANIRMGRSIGFLCIFFGKKDNRRWNIVIHTLMQSALFLWTGGTWCNARSKSTKRCNMRRKAITKREE